ncbi:MAG: hypothetical protein HC902_05100 [Calothrix sp. SM1_5_4]|nr:hypothetical protein [Calothrix sp. SM1_5_4]
MNALVCSTVFILMPEFTSRCAGWLLARVFFMTELVGEEQLTSLQGPAVLVSGRPLGRIDRLTLAVLVRRRVGFKPGDAGWEDLACSESPLPGRVCLPLTVSRRRISIGPP